MGVRPGRTIAIKKGGFVVHYVGLARAHVCSRTEVLSYAKGR